MRHYPFKLVNVFAETQFGGNPLVVFPQADGLSDEEMQQIAKQFNLSEAVFAFSSDQSAVANLRIFTPHRELLFAGHPTLGAAFVLQKLHNLPKQFVLNTQAKVVGLSGKEAKMELAIQGYDIQKSLANPHQLAQITGLNEQQISDTAYWLDSGSPHLLLQVLEYAGLENVKIDPCLLNQICQIDEQKRSAIYIWYEENENIYSRFFYANKTVVQEDSGTGSACANLGAYFLSQRKYPLSRLIHQGDLMCRPNRLHLKLDENQFIYIGGNVIEIGEGIFKLV
ncbi:PhzF family phenazine biosynthesis protein [Rodentibacter caecimuris]|uniref:Phenazine biosynthesis protein PhzF n=1 Tax=Rodentibacter caecimuris TaxID=1796644 RepID=A0ABX3KYF8_9PAST|nr:phenazine biosynthesis protein PhzF [Rodentibacter heylii]